ncbi:hypothetical protein ACVWXO_001380 [Bradyrhizobium sp. LM2.7]
MVWPVVLVTIGSLDSFGIRYLDRVRLGQHLGQRLVRIEVQLDVDLDRRGAEHRGRGDVVDTLGGSDRLFDRRGDEALDQVGGGAGIDGRDVDDRVRQLRILPDRQHHRRTQADQQDQQADDDRQDRALDENIGKGHRGDLDFYVSRKVTRPGPIT